MIHGIGEAMETLDDVATGYDEAAKELERAAKHLRHSAELFREKEVPRGCAHVFAAYGHIQTSQTIIDKHAQVHRLKASVPDDN